ncbi:nuclear transport factor 2 family protein [Paenarthrobacter sp. NPDC057981]|uniref:nuclear transport factor 2 family protein n=1 Tax=Paenarthrobacter sp. NPDC057981 TaxID=3346297 RepID=UPI0036D88D9B
MIDLSMHDRVQICETKARYFRLLDTRQWDALFEVFTVDARIEGMPEAWGPLNSPADFITRAKEHFGKGVVSVHHGHMPEITATGPSTARGIWSMEDYVTWPRGDRSYRGVRNPDQWGIRGFGHYEDELRRVDDGWRISFLRLTRLRIDPLVGDEAQEPGFEMVRLSPDWLTSTGT